MKAQRSDVILLSLGVVAAAGLIFLARRSQSVVVISGLLCFTGSSVGLCGILYPSGVIRWAKPLFRKLDPSDETWWWAPKLAGSSFILLSVLVTILNLLNR